MTSFSNLPDDIFINILSRLPPKSIGCCRCVSKQWKFLLTQPEFIKTHLLQTIANPHQSIAFPTSRRSIGYVPLSSAHQLFDEMPLTLKTSHHPRLPRPLGSIDGSCHGLVLAACSVLNLVTGEIRELPDPPPYCSDPDEDYERVWGFGYDSVRNDYKIVTVSYSGVAVDDDGNQLDPDESSEMFIDVFSFKNGTWTRRFEGFSFDYFIDCGKGVFVDGCINWLAFGATDDHKNYIVAFNLVTEKLSEVHPPASLMGSQFSQHFLLVLVGGCLCMHHVTEKYFWMMKDYGVKESWTKFTINVPNLHQIELLCLLSQEEVVMYANAKKLMVYNVKDGTSKDIAVRGVSRLPWTEISFIETLVSPYAW